MTQGTEIKTKVAEKVTEKRRLKDLAPTKVLIRRLPPTLTAETLLEQISPLPNYDFFYFMRADLSLGPNAFSRAYINFPNYEDISNFRDKFDDYVFVDPKGNEYPAIVEFAAFQKVPKRRPKKPDSKKGTIEQDPDYEKFLESLENPDLEPVSSLDTFLEELEAKEREAKGAPKGGPRVTTPLIEYIKKRKEEKRNAILRSREEKRKRDLERKQSRDEERRRRRERERELDKERDLRRQKERDGQRNKDKEEGDGPVKLLKHSEKEDSKSDKDQGDKPCETGNNSGESRDRSGGPVDKSGDTEDRSVETGERSGEDRRDGRDKPKDEKARLRFSRENRGKIREQRDERRDERTKSSPVKSDRPRSGRDDWSSRDGDKGDRFRDDHRSDRDRPRPKSYREEREQRRQNRESDQYRDERPRSGPPRKDDKKYRDDPRDRVRSQGQRSDTGRSDYRRNDRDYGRADRDRRNDRPLKNDTAAKPNRDTREVGKSVGDSNRLERDREFNKDRDRPKSESKLNPSREATSNEETSDKKGERKRKERPERAIYDPRKALERRQGAKKDSDQSPRISPRDSDPPEKDQGGGGSV